MIGLLHDLRYVVKLICKGRQVTSVVSFLPPIGYDNKLFHNQRRYMYTETYVKPRLSYGKLYQKIVKLRQFAYFTTRPGSLSGNCKTMPSKDALCVPFSFQSMNVSGSTPIDNRQAAKTSRDEKTNRNQQVRKLHALSHIHHRQAVALSCDRAS